MVLKSHASLRPHKNNAPIQQFFSKKLFLILLYLFNINIAFGQELITITPENFLNQNPSPERKAIVDFITHQFDGKSVTQKDLDQLWNDDDAQKTQQLSRFQIIDQQVYADSYKKDHHLFLILKKYFEELVKQYKINNVDFIVYVSDLIPAINNDKVITIPAFVMYKNLDSIYEQNKLLLPDAFFVTDNWKKLIHKIEQASDQYPWKIKENKIFWRGSSTGCAKNDPYNMRSYNIKNFDQLPRLSLVMLSKLYPDLIDAKLAYYQQFSKDKDGDNLKKILNMLFGKGPKNANEEEHLKYKYLISVDGNAATGTRVPWIMLSNSVLMKQNSNNIEWFYSALKPYTNYIPINERLTNLFEQIEWMKNHDQELQQISFNAHNFVKNNLMPEAIDAHMVIILNEYSKIQLETPKRTFQ